MTSPEQDGDREESKVIKENINLNKNHRNGDSQQPNGVHDLCQPVSVEICLVVPASIKVLLCLWQCGRKKSPSDELHQAMGHLLNHFLSNAGFTSKGAVK